MAGSGGALNLSLLSRGVGEVTKNGHEKIEVLFEPQDYYNFVDSHRRIYLPPIDPQYAFDTAPTFSSRRRKPQVLIPKTFTTRKGALLLFSEDMAHRTRDTHAVRRHHHHDPSRILEEESSLSQSVDESDLRTVEDLTKSILSYGQEGDDAPGYLNLKFMPRRKRDYFDRQIRPGFSAKRYLSSWTKCWDDSVLEKVISKGYLTEKSLFYYNPLMPHLQRRLNDDMSHYPVPYKLMRSMLVSPGSLSGYTFYRVRPESAESIMTQEAEMVPGLSQQASIKVISTKDGIQREVTYASLDKKAKEEVLTDLLVKSAVHYAMKKQQEFIEDNYNKTIEPKKLHEMSEDSKSSLPQFDMKDAVDSLLDTHKSKAALLDADIPDDKSQLSDHSGSFKGKAKRSKKPKPKDRPGAVSPGRREYVAGAAVISLQESESPSSVPQLPQIPGQLAPLPPIGEASREQSKVPLSLPPIGKDDADDEWAPREQEDARQRSVEADRRRRDEHKHRKKKLGEGPMVAGGSYLQSSSESIASVHSVPPSKPQRTHFKGSNQSLRSFGSKRGAGSTEESSNKGSVVLGPDGEVIPLGGKIQFTPRQDAPHIEQVVSANQIEQSTAQIGKDLNSDDSDVDEPDEWKHSKPLRKGDSMRNFANRRESLPSQISEQDIVDALTEHAQQIASDILKKDETGQDLTRDARRAAEMWMSKFPPGRRLSRSQSIQELPDTSVMESVMKSHKRKSAGPTYAEYRELIKESLATAISNASGEELPVDFIPQDAEISKELIDALASASLSPDDIEIVQDEETGKSVIRSKSQMSQALGGVKEGHIYVPVANNGNKVASSIPAERASVVDIGQFDVIKYGTAETASKAGSEKTHDERSVSEKAPSEKTPSEKGSSVKGKSQPPSIMGESIIEENEVQTVVSEGKKSSVTFKDEEEPPQEEQPVDEFQEAVEKVQQEIEEEKMDQKSEVSKKSEAKEEPAKTPKSAKSLLSQKSEDKKSKVSEQSAAKSKTPEKKEEFVVGKVKQKNELEQLYGQVEPPAPKEPTPPVKKPEVIPKKPEPIPKKQETKPKASVQPPKEKPAEKQPEPLAPVLEASNVDYKGELEKLFGKLPTGKDKGKPNDKPKGKPAAKKPAKGKGKKGAKKKEEVEKVPEPPPAKEPTPPPPKEPTPPPPPPEPKPDVESEKESVDESYKSEEEDDFEFNIVRDSPSPEPANAPSVIESSGQSAIDDTTEAEEEYDEDDEAARLRMISNREARAAKRAAQAEKRKKEVERRRREREEQSKREKEESERQEMLRRELEEERRRNEENRRRRRELEEEEREREEREENEKERQRLLEIEREKKRKEEYQRKLEEIKRKQLEEEKRRHEEQLQRQKEEEERRKEEEEMMAKMAEEERLEYERKKKLEEEERKRKEEEDRKRREEEAQKAMEEARRLAEEMARKQAELEARLQFNRTIQVESSGLHHSQNINPAFVFSYFELLSWLGLDIPEFELMKLNQY